VSVLAREQVVIGAFHFLNSFTTNGSKARNRTFPLARLNTHPAAVITEVLANARGELRVSQSGATDSGAQQSRQCIWKFAPRTAPVWQTLVMIERKPGSLTADSYLIIS